LWKISSYLVTNFSVTLFWVFFFVLNRTRVIGRHHVGEAPNTILLSNHQSMIDSFLVGLGAYYPKSLVKPYLIPWNPAATENFYKTPILAWLADKWRCIPVREGRRDLKSLKDMIRVLPRGVMVLFPEGSRTRDGSVGAGRAGAGALILATQPRVIPVAIHGMREVLPIGKSIPRIGKRIIVSYGAPMDYREYLNGHSGRDAAQAVVDRVMERIRSQHAELTGCGHRKMTTRPPDSPSAFSTR